MKEDGLLNSSCFLQGIETFEINGTRVKHDDTYPMISQIITEMPTLKYVKLIGTSLGENLDVFSQSLRHPSIVGLDL